MKEITRVQFYELWSWYLQTGKDCDKLISEVKKLNETVKKLINPIEEKTVWSTTEEACEYLKIARRTLNRNMDRFSYGHHYFRKDPGNARSKIVWHLPRLEKYFCTPVAYRRRPRTRRAKAA